MLDTLAAAPWFCNLRALSLSGDLIMSHTADSGPTAALRVLIDAELPHLQSLTLAHAGFNHKDFPLTLALAPWLATLESLTIENSRLGPRGAAALAHLPLPRLQRLTLTRNNLEADGFVALGGAPWLRRLAALEICEVDAQQRGACEALQYRPELPVTALQLEGRAKITLA